jgi:DNA-binding transcriptional MocR family regulator
MDHSPSSLLYQRVARHVEAQITSGALCAGDRLPSVRVLARTAGVSIATVNQAYLQLERRGLLRARPRSGYFVAAAPPAVPLPASRTPAGRRPRSVASDVIDTVLQSLRRTDLLALNSAASAFSKRLDGRLNRLTRQVLREQPELPNTLTMPPGDAALRRAVAQRLALAGTLVSPEHVVVTAGTMEAIALSLGVLCRAGDTVLVESPTYFGVLQAVEHFRLKVVEVANRPGAGIDVDAVAALVARQPIAAAVLMPTFNNPTGALTSAAGKARLAQVLGAAGVPVIEDDIYGELHLGPERPRLLASFSGGTVITCGSVSKSLAMGYRVGWAVSAEFAQDIARAKFCTSVACPSLQQRVLARYFDSGGYDRHLRQLREELNVDCQRYREAIARHFPPGTAVSDPDGGLVLWLELPEDVDGRALFEQALDERIGIAPGMIFSAKGEYRNYVRLAMGGGWNASIDDALRRLGRLAGSGTVRAQR